MLFWTSLSQGDKHMNEIKNTVVYFALAMFFLAILACRNYAPIDPEVLESNDLSGQDFRGKSMIKLDLSNKDLRNVDFSGSNLEGANLSNSDLRGAKFEHSILVGADFTGAKLDERWIPIIDVLTTLNGADQDLRGFDLSWTYLAAADLKGADLRGVDLSRAWLPNADLSNTNLSGANLQNSSLNGAILNDANLTDVRVNNRTNLSYAVLTGATISQDTLRQVILSCTRMPDGTIHDEEACNGTPPPP